MILLLCFGPENAPPYIRPVTLVNKVPGTVTSPVRCRGQVPRYGCSRRSLGEGHIATHWITHWPPLILCPAMSVSQTSYLHTELLP